MSQKTIRLLREFAAATTNHWTFFSVAMVFAAETKLTGFAFLGWLCAGFLPVLLYIIRAEVGSIILQLCTFPIFMGIIALLPIRPEIIKGILFLFGTVYVLLSLFSTIRGKSLHMRFLPPFVCLGINLFIAIFILPKRDVYYFPFLFFDGMIITCLFFFLAFYLDQYLIFVARNEETSNSMPKGKIFQSGIHLSLQYLGAGGLILFFIAIFALSDEFLRLFWGRIQAAIKRFLSFIFGTAAPETKPQILDGGEGGWLRPDLEGGTQSIFWKIVEVIMMYLLAILLFVFILNLVLKFLRFIGRFRPKKIIIEADEEVEDLDVHENLTSKKKILDNDEDEGLLSARQRIRRIFRRKALASEIEPSQLPYSTAQEVAAQYENPVLSEIYEKARYSTLSCEKEDVRRLMQSFQRKA